MPASVARTVTVLSVTVIMSKGKDEGIGQICTSKPIWFDSRSAIRLDIYPRLCYTAITVKLIFGGAYVLSEYSFSRHRESFASSI